MSSRLFQNFPMLLDGATGTNLMRDGMPQGVCVETWILDHPQVLQNLQRDYARAGSNAVMAPTFETNRHKLAQYGLEDKVEPLIKDLVALSREAVGDKVLVAGNLSPTGLFIEPLGELTFDELTDLYLEQALALERAGVDYIALETFMSLTEARSALLAAKQTGLPVTVTLTVDQNGRTLSGGSVPACLFILASMGADAVGLNCSTGPDIILRCLKEAAPLLSVPVIAKPNAGLPVEGKTGVYDISPLQFAQKVPDFLAAGISILGGCCGTTPEHIGLMRETIDRLPDPIPADGTCSAGLPLAAGERSLFEIGPDILPSAQTVACEDLAETLGDISGGPIRIPVHNADDAREFGMNAPFLSAGPVIFSSGDAQALEAALKLYQGRALIEAGAGIGDRALSELAE
ncbi:MAG TPA: homocysteine S-methyltransferase family protein, partial [Clostridia bacterium]|nr:homocysteine S-methyltransferase family protein [Clostridia bacterium]